MPPDDDEPEPSIVEYARFYGISIDHNAAFPAQDELDYLLQTTPAESEDDARLPQLQPVEIEPPEDRITLEKEGAKAIREADTGPLEHAEYQKSLGRLCRERKRTPKLKCELPLLKTLHEVDYKVFKQAIEKGREVDLDQLKTLPLEPLDDEKDEGLEFPSKYHDVPAVLLKQGEKEKIGISKDAMLVLACALKNEWSEEDNKKLIMSQITYKRVWFHKCLPFP
jgi:hypothetical protein